VLKPTGNWELGKTQTSERSRQLGTLKQKRAPTGKNVLNGHPTLEFQVGILAIFLELQLSDLKITEMMIWPSFFPQVPSCLESTNRQTEIQHNPGNMNKGNYKNTELLQMFMCTIHILSPQSVRNGRLNENVLRVAINCMGRKL
jgi:hypothetical protein